MHIKTEKLTISAIIAAAYAALTFFSAILGIAYGGVQFRLSEMLCVLPIFTTAAIPGLAVGCVAANIISSVGPIDAIIGTAATLLAAILTREFRNIKIKNYPFLSMFMPVIINAVIVGAEIAFFSSSQTFWTVFAFNAFTVFIGQAVVVFLPGNILYFYAEKHPELKKLLTGEISEI